MNLLRKAASSCARGIAPTRTDRGVSTQSRQLQFSGTCTDLEMQPSNDAAADLAWSPRTLRSTHEQALRQEEIKRRLEFVAGGGPEL